MKLLALLSDAFGGRGGIAKFNRDLLQVLLQMPSCDQLVALPRVVRDEVGALPSRLSFRTSSAGSKAKYLQHVVAAVASERFDGVISGHVNLAPLAALAAAAARAPLIQIIHGVEAWTPHRSAAVRRALRRATVVVAVSEHSKQRFTSWSGVDPERVQVVPNSIDRSLFTPGPKSDHLLRRYQLHGRRVILTLGRLEPNERYKGIDEVLEVLPTVAETVPSISYLIVGEGEDRARLEQKAQRFGMGDRVVFTGYVPEAEKAEHFRLADAYVMPGWGEGFGIVYLEALACGVPVVASTKDASREAVRNGALGRVVDPGDRAALTEAILDVLSAERGKVPEGLDFFSRERFRERWESVIAKALSGGSNIAEARVSSGTDARRTASELFSLSSRE